MKILWSIVHLFCIWYIFVCGYGAARDGNTNATIMCIILLVLLRSHYLGGIKASEEE